MATDGTVHFTPTPTLSTELTPTPTPRIEREAFCQPPAHEGFGCARCRADARLNEEVRVLLNGHHMQLQRSLESWMARQDDLVRKLLHQPLNGGSNSNADFIATSSPRYQKNEDGKSRANGLLAETPARRRPSGPSGMCSDWSLNIQASDRKRRVNAEFEAEKAERPASTDVHTPQWRRVFKAVVDSTQFQAFFATILLANAVLIGIEVEYMVAVRRASSPLALTIVGHTCSAIFFLELMMRFAAHGFNFLRSGDWLWILLDVFFVLCSLIEFILEIIVATGGNVNNMSHLRVVRIMRLTRLVRSFRLPRIIRFVSGLCLLVSCIVGTLRSLVWAGVLLLMLTYVFAIAFTQAANEKIVSGLGVDDDPNLVVELLRYWGSLWTSIFTLYKSITGGISWHEVVEPLGEIHVIWSLLFTVFISISYFAVLNVITGVFCNSAIATATRDPDMIGHTLIEEKKKYMKNLKTLFKNVDADASGLVTLREFEMLMSDDVLKAYFAALEIESDDAWTLFKLIDKDKTNFIDIDEFVRGCIELRGVAKAIDVSQLLESNRVLNKRVAKLTQYVERYGALHRVDSEGPADMTDPSNSRELAIASMTSLRV